MGDVTLAYGGEVGGVRALTGMRFEADPGDSGSPLARFLPGPNSTARARSANVREQIDSAQEADNGESSVDVALESFLPHRTWKYLKVTLNQ